MSRLDMIDPAAATGKTKELLEGVAKKLGFLPTLMRVLANSPSAQEDAEHGAARCGDEMPDWVKD